MGDGSFLQPRKFNVSVAPGHHHFPLQKPLISMLLFRFHWSTLPSGSDSHSSGKSPLKKLEKPWEMAIFNSYILCLPEGFMYGTRRTSFLDLTSHPADSCRKLPENQRRNGSHFIHEFAVESSVGGSVLSRFCADIISRLTKNRLVVTGTWLLLFHMLGMIIPMDSYFSGVLKPPTRKPLQGSKSKSVWKKD